jgi:GNAT superfamily N-acetyltransferase
VLLRPATPQDAAAIAAVHVASWQVAYRGLLPDALLDGLDVDRRRTGWERLLTGAPRHGAVVAEDDGRITGFAHTVPARDDDADEGTGEVTSIYTVAEAWGSGTGRALMAAAIEQLRAAGFRSATLWVLDSNGRARRFYERAGWTVDGAVKDDDLAGTPVRELRYRRNL